ncbi:unnamed protein product [Amoebophrya sp. A120]|nr:unnamed protein product [Amoebophrya sp. A120]|eukprot:GSA120T00001514001.1
MGAEKGTTPDNRPMEAVEDHQGPTSLDTQFDDFDEQLAALERLVHTSSFAPGPVRSSLDYSENQSAFSTFADPVSVFGAESGKNRFSFPQAQRFNEHVSDEKYAAVGKEDDQNEHALQHRDALNTTSTAAPSFPRSSRSHLLGFELREIQVQEPPDEEQNHVERHKKTSQNKSKKLGLRLRYDTGEILEIEENSVVDLHNARALENIAYGQVVRAGDRLLRVQGKSDVRAALREWDALRPPRPILNLQLRRELAQKRQEIKAERAEKNKNTDAAAGVPMISKTEVERLFFANVNDDPEALRSDVRAQAVVDATLGHVTSALNQRPPGFVAGEVNAITRSISLEKKAKDLHVRTGHQPANASAPSSKSTVADPFTLRTADNVPRGRSVFAFSPEQGEITEDSKRDRESKNSEKKARPSKTATARSVKVKSKSPSGGTVDTSSAANADQESTVVGAKEPEPQPALLYPSIDALSTRRAARSARIFDEPEEGRAAASKRSSVKSKPKGILKVHTTARLQENLPTGQLQAENFAGVRQELTNMQRILAQRRSAERMHSAGRSRSASRDPAQERQFVSQQTRNLGLRSTSARRREENRLRAEAARLSTGAGDPLFRDAAAMVRDFASGGVDRSLSPTRVLRANEERKALEVRKKNRAIFLEQKRKRKQLQEQQQQSSTFRSQKRLKSRTPSPVKKRRGKQHRGALRAVNTTFLSEEASTILPPSELLYSTSSDEDDSPGPGHYNPKYDAAARSNPARGGTFGKAKRLVGTSPVSSRRQQKNQTTDDSFAFDDEYGENLSTITRLSEEPSVAPRRGGYIGAAGPAAPPRVPTESVRNQQLLEERPLTHCDIDTELKHKFSFAPAARVTGRAPQNRARKKRNIKVAPTSNLVGDKSSQLDGSCVAHQGTTLEDEYSAALDHDEDTAESDTDATNSESEEEDPSAHLGPGSYDIAKPFGQNAKGTVRYRKPTTEEKSIPSKVEKEKAAALLGPGKYEIEEKLASHHRRVATHSFKHGPQRYRILRIVRKSGTQGPVTVGVLPYENLHTLEYGCASKVVVQTRKRNGDAGAVERSNYAVQPSASTMLFYNDSDFTAGDQKLHSKSTVDSASDLQDGGPAASRRKLPGSRHISAFSFAPPVYSSRLQKLQKTGSRADFSYLREVGKYRHLGPNTYDATNAFNRFRLRTAPQALSFSRATGRKAAKVQYDRRPLGRNLHDALVRLKRARTALITRSLSPIKTRRLNLNRERTVDRLYAREALMPDCVSFGPTSGSDAGAFRGRNFSRHIDFADFADVEERKQKRSRKILVSREPWRFGTSSEMLGAAATRAGSAPAEARLKQEDATTSKSSYKVRSFDKSAPRHDWKVFPQQRNFDVENFLDADEEGDVLILDPVDPTKQSAHLNNRLVDYARFAPRGEDFNLYPRTRDQIESAGGDTLLLNPHGENKFADHLPCMVDISRSERRGAVGVVSSSGNNRSSSQPVPLLVHRLGDEPDAEGKATEGDQCLLHVEEARQRAVERHSRAADFRYVMGHPNADYRLMEEDQPHYPGELLLFWEGYPDAMARGYESA